MLVAGRQVTWGGDSTTPCDKEEQHRASTNNTEDGGSKPSGGGRWASPPGRAMATTATRGSTRSSSVACSEGVADTINHSSESRKELPPHIVNTSGNKPVVATRVKMWVRYGVYGETNWPHDSTAGSVVCVLSSHDFRRHSTSSG